jgi:hypothetical protein
MYTSFSNSLQAAANMAEARVGNLTRIKPTRKRSGSDLNEPNQPSTAINEVCHYDHIRDHVPATHTIPKLETTDDTLPETGIQTWAPTRPPTPQFIPESPPITDREHYSLIPTYRTTSQIPVPKDGRTRTENPIVGDQSASSDDTCFYGSMMDNHETAQKSLL